MRQYAHLMARQRPGHEQTVGRQQEQNRRRQRCALLVPQSFACDARSVLARMRCERMQIGAQREREREGERKREREKESLAHHQGLTAARFTTVRPLDDIASSVPRSAPFSGSTGLGSVPIRPAGLPHPWGATTYSTCFLTSVRAWRVAAGQEGGGASSCQGEACIAHLQRAKRQWKQVLWRVGDTGLELRIKARHGRRLGAAHILIQ